MSSPRVALQASDDGEDAVLRCNFVLPIKNRRCRMLRKRDELYCGEHSPSRRPCPLDPSHTVSPDKLEEHLAKLCNARLSLINQPYMKENINVRQPTGAHSSPKPAQEDFRRVAAILDSLRFEAIPEVQLRAGVVEAALNTPGETMGWGRKRHLIQISSLIGHLAANDLVPDSPDHCVVELGSGKAQLSYWLAQQFPAPNYLLVDRQGCRNKFDRRAVRENTQLRFERIRCPVEHVDLSELDVIKSASTVSAVCKHFCGAATDYGIRCLLNPALRSRLVGMVLAPCCHHLSLHEQFSGLDHLRSAGVASPEDFHALRHISTWALCAFPDSGQSSPRVEHQGPMGDNEAHGQPPPVPPEWTNAMKAALGVKAKTLLEQARVEALRSGGFNAHLCRYVTSEVSLENFLIVATTTARAK